MECTPKLYVNDLELEIKYERKEMIFFGIKIYLDVFASLFLNIL